MDTKIIEFVELRIDHEGRLCGRSNFRIDIRKLPRFINDNEHEYGYVKELIENGIEAAKNGRTEIADTSTKYSFGDTPCWWNEIITDEPVDAVVTYEAYL